MKKNRMITVFVQVCCAMAIMLGSHQAVQAKKMKITGVINLNTASQEQLKLLPRVGPKMAKRIIAFRKKNKFTKITDIMKVRGIGQKTFKRMKTLITVKSKTTARPATSKPPTKR